MATTIKGSHCQPVCVDVFYVFLTVMDLTEGLTV